jgi:nucleotide-binding universal stress UspA family protein
LRPRGGGKGSYAVADEHELIREGRHAAVILEESDVLAADLIVIIARGRTRTGPIRTGDVAQKVVKYASCSVLVVR